MLDAINRDRKNISAFHLEHGERTIFSSILNDDGHDIMVYVCPDYVTAKKVHSQMVCLGSNAVLLPAKDDVLAFRKIRSLENSLARIDAMGVYCSAEKIIIVTTIEATCQLYPTKKDFTSNIITLKKGEDYDLNKLANKLTMAGYKRESQINGAGQFSVRGDIVDIYSATLYSGVRLEFFGDTCESIKIFDGVTQKTTGDLDKVTLFPNTEIFYNPQDSDSLLQKVSSDMVKPDSVESVNTLADISLELSTGSRDMSLGFIMPLIPHTTFYEFFTPSIVVFDDVKMVTDNANILYTEHQNIYKSNLSRGGILKCSISQLADKQASLRCLGGLNEPQKMGFHLLDSQNRLFDPQAVFKFSSTIVPNYTKNYTMLCDDVGIWSKGGFKVFLYTGSDIAGKGLIGIFESQKKESYLNNPNVTIVNQFLESSAFFPEEKLVFIATNDIFQKANKQVIKRSKKDIFTVVQAGSYVVHSTHGIGYFDRIERLGIGSGKAERDYAVINYRDSDVLYVPIENIDILSAYGDSEKAPKLSKLGGKDFDKIKAKVKASVSELAVNLVKLYADRELAKGYKYSTDTVMQSEFDNDFPYTETADQLDATADCITDLTSGKVMDRLICGDVGYGKTEVAMRVAYKVISEGKQVAFLSPTTILASQHFNSVVKRMDKFGVTVKCLTRFTSKEESEKIINGLASGSVDIVCGTHRLLSKDIRFNDLGLLVLDEEQRFGVGDKEKIKLLKTNINVLTLSATPIPRTLHMSLSGVRDISILDTPPSERIPISTYACEQTDSLIFDSCMREINRGGQVFIVYNRVESIDRFALKVQGILGSDIRIAVGHGQMRENMLEDVITDFIAHKYDVLIASTIIENGIDIPNANTMIVIDADMFGLSQLYQLRGRVGRSNKLAYTYFTYKPDRALSSTAYKRLDAITRFTDFGSGFKIAMRDLEIRGAGNMLGKEQHGHIEKVGYDMYYKILASEVAQNGGKAVSVKEGSEVKVATDFSAFIPESYIPSNSWRMRVYSRISQISTLKAQKELVSELNDIYGKVPTPVGNLIFIAFVKNLAGMVKAKSVSIKKDNCFVGFYSEKDVPKTGFGKIDKVSHRVNFGSDRTALVKFLISCIKKEC